MPMMKNQIAANATIKMAASCAIFVVLSMDGIILVTQNWRKSNMWKIQVTTVWNDGWEDYEYGFTTEEAANMRQTELEEGARQGGLGEGYRVVPQN